jgi:hypothetical protein
MVENEGHLKKVRLSVGVTIVEDEKREKGRQQQEKRRSGETKAGR